MRSKPPLANSAADPATTYAARYGDGTRASRVPATVKMMADGLLVQPADGGPVLWPYADLRTAEPIRSRSLDAVLTSRHALRATLFVDDTLLLALLLQRSPQLKLSAERWRTAQPGLAVGAVALAVYAGIWAFDLSPTKGVARAMPDRARVALGDSVIRTMPAQKRCMNAQGQAALGKLMQRLMPRGPISADNIVVLDWALLNAFAVPGNRIVLTRALIEQAQGPDEIAAVIGHEAGHSIEYHPEASLVRSVGFWALVQMVFTGTPGAIGNIGVVLAQLGYTRTAEREADGHALRLLQEARISPKGMGDFFRRLDKRAVTPKVQQASAVSDILSSHPSNPERIARIDKQPTYEATPALADDDWKALKAICSNSEGAPAAVKPTTPNAPRPDTASKQPAVDAAKSATVRAAAEAAKAEAAKREAALQDVERLQAAKAEAEAMKAAQAAASAANAKAEAERREAIRREAARVEAVRIEAAKAEAARLENARLEAVKAAEALKAETVLAEAAKAAGVKAEASSAGSPKREIANAENTQAETGKPEVPKVDAEPSIGKQAMAAAVPGPQAAAPRASSAATPLENRIAEANKRIAVNATDQAALVDRGQAMAAKQDAAGAIEDFTRALALKPADASTLFWRASMYAQRGLLEQAIGDYSDVIRLQPRNFAAFNNRGSLYRSQKKLDLALRDYTQAIAIDGKQAIALTNRALIHREKSDLDNAMVDLNTAIAANPAYASAYVRRGETLELKSLRDAAIADYRRVLRFPEVAGVTSEPHTTARGRLTALGVKF